MKTKFLPAMLVVVSFIGCNGFLAAAFDMGTPTSHTPYDSYLGPVHEVFDHLGNNQPDPEVVKSLLREGHSFRYYFNSAQPYVPQEPPQTDQIKAGDCKAKSLWLAFKMGTAEVRYVIGKARAESTMSHAWIIWNSPRGWWILDATNYSDPLNLDHISSSEFIPQYSYSTTGKFVHSVAGGARESKYADHL